VKLIHSYLKSIITRYFKGGTLTKTLNIMKKLLLLFGLSFFLGNATIWALPTTKPIVEEKTEVLSAKEQKRSQKKQEKWQKKKDKLEKKFQKLEKKLAKKGADMTKARNGVWDDDTFKLGALIALGGLLLTILGVLPILGGIFSVIGGLMMIVGVGLMIWVLIESY